MLLMIQLKSPLMQLKTKLPLSLYPKLLITEFHPWLQSSRSPNGLLCLHRVLRHRQQQDRCHWKIRVILLIAFTMTNMLLIWFPLGCLPSVAWWTCTVSVCVPLLSFADEQHTFSSLFPSHLSLSFPPASHITRWTLSLSLLTQNPLSNPSREVTHITVFFSLMHFNSINICFCLFSCNKHPLHLKKAA